MKRVLSAMCLALLLMSSGIGRAHADYLVTFGGYTATGPMNTSSTGVCSLVGSHFSGSWDPRAIFPNSNYYPGSAYGNANLVVSGNIGAGTDASTFYNYTDNKGVKITQTAIGPGCVFGGAFGAGGVQVKIWAAATLSCNSTTEDLVNGACSPKCTSTQERNSSGTCVAACQQPYTAGVEFVAGETRMARVCMGSGGITVNTGTGSTSGDARPYCWHYVGSKTGSGVTSGGVYWEDYSVSTTSGDVCATLGTKDCPSGAVCPVINNPNQTSTGGSSGSTSTGSTSTGGTSTGGTSTGGTTSGGSSQVAAVNYCANTAISTTARGTLCNVDGSGRAFVAASSTSDGLYSICAVPAASGAGTNGNGTDSKACYASNYSASMHSAVCLTESNDIPLYAGPSAAGYNITAGSADTACLASSSPSAIHMGADNVGATTDPSMVGHWDAPRVYHCQYVKTAVGTDVSGGTVYRYKPLGSACLGGAATTTDTSGSTSTGGTSTGGTTTGGTSTGGSSTGGTSTGGTSTGGTSTGGGSTTTTSTTDTVTPPGTPSVPGSSSFYSPSFPNGIAGVVQSRTAEAKNTGIIRWLQGYNVVDGGSWEPKWTLALGKFGNHVIEIPAWVIGALRAIVLVSAILTARKIVFGG